MPVDGDRPGRFQCHTCKYISLHQHIPVKVHVSRGRVQIAVYRVDRRNRQAFPFQRHIAFRTGKILTAAFIRLTSFTLKRLQFLSLIGLHDISINVPADYGRKNGVISSKKLSLGHKLHFPQHVVIHGTVRENNRSRFRVRIKMVFKIAVTAILLGSPLRHENFLVIQLPLRKLFQRFLLDAVSNSVFL